MSAFGAMPLTIIRKRERQKKSRLKKNMSKTAVEQKQNIIKRTREILLLSRERRIFPICEVCEELSYLVFTQRHRMPFFVKQKLLYDPFVIGIFCAEAEVLSFV